MASEIAQLQQQLQQRDQLISQLSSELFRLVKQHPPTLPAARSGGADEQQRSDLSAMAEQIEFYQQQIDKRDLEIVQLQQNCQKLSERNQMLETIVQELPEVYRQKFTERLDVVKSKVQSLQSENRQLHRQLQQSDEQPIPEPKGRWLSLPSRRQSEEKSLSED